MQSIDVEQRVQEIHGLYVVLKGEETRPKRVKEKNPSIMFFIVFGLSSVQFFPWGCAFLVTSHTVSLFVCYLPNEGLSNGQEVEGGSEEAVWRMPRTNSSTGIAYCNVP